MPPIPLTTLLFRPNTIRHNKQNFQCNSIPQKQGVNIIMNELKYIYFDLYSVSSAMLKKRQNKEWTKVTKKKRKYFKHRL